jgi:hypothetical protein
LRALDFEGDLDEFENLYAGIARTDISADGLS